MSLALAALASILAALLQVTIAPNVALFGAAPSLLLVLVVVWTIIAGLNGGLVIAFLGGLILDSLAMRPLGSTAFTLLLVAGGASLLPRLVSQGRSFLPIPAILVASFVQPILLHVLLVALKGSGHFSDPFGALLPGAIYNGLLVLAMTPIAARLQRRYMVRERLGW